MSATSCEAPHIKIRGSSDMADAAAAAPAMSRAAIDGLTLGMVGYLEAHPLVAAVEISRPKGVDKHALAGWERVRCAWARGLCVHAYVLSAAVAQRFAPCQMPDDMGEFFSMQNGMSLRWSVQAHGMPCASVPLCARAHCVRARCMRCLQARCPPLDA